ncbi:sodium:solute symporter [Flagellimonas sp. S3867]|uniref:sodium:solute symporter family protein n=1 Tax=Flagellimonas sp. S3867 TaxID=2768063 RepID=UPI001683D793|nr:sodium:solute symporter family protein [Flagellimonas sp. S3867]
MTNFDLLVDGTIVLVYLIGTITAGLWVKRYIRNLNDFLVAGRSVDLYLGIASLAATEFGIATCMANAELGYKYGFAGITPGIALAFAMFIVGWTGFCIKPLRDREVVTLPELFANKFGTKVRWASGVVIVLGGLLNMGVFLRQAGIFLTIVCGFEIGYLEVVMTLILLGVAIYTILGGMISVFITDYIQFVVMSIGLIAVVLLLVVDFGWFNMLQSLDDSLGSQAYNPFASETYGIDKILLDVLVAFAAVLTWQTIISRVLSAKNTKIAKRIFIGTSPFLLVRFTIPAILGIAALHYFGTQLFVNEEAILAMPNLLAKALPVGLIGILIAAMLAADMSTNSSYMIAWSSVIYNDIMKPIHKGLWSDKKGLLWNRILIAIIGVFLLLYGLWYPLKGDLWVYLQVTGTIYLSSMSVLLISACYWKPANNWGAIASIAVGGIIPISYLILQELDATQTEILKIGPYKFGVATYFATAVAMILGSKLKLLIRK